MSGIISLPNHEEFFIKSITLYWLVIIAREYIDEANTDLVDELRNVKMFKNADFDEIAQFHPELVRPVATVLRNASAELRPMLACQPDLPEWFVLNVETLARMEATLTQEYGLEERPSQPGPNGEEGQQIFIPIIVPGYDDFRIKQSALWPLINTAKALIDPEDKPLADELNAAGETCGIVFEALEAEDPGLARRMAAAVAEGAVKLQSKLTVWPDLPPWLQPTVDELGRLSEALRKRYELR